MSKLNDVVNIILLFALNIRGGSRISEGVGVRCIKVCGFALLILSIFFLISHENEIIWSQ